jgi:hypothetical protein
MIRTMIEDAKRISNNRVDNKKDFNIIEKETIFHRLDRRVHIIDVGIKTYENQTIVED